MKLDIITFPDEFLRKKAEPITEITDEVKELAANMIETMYEAPGVGLAAPQVGRSIRMIVLDDRPRDDDSEPTVLINPEIIDKDGELLEEEGCLSLPGEYAFVKRFENIKFRYTTLDGDTIEATADGMLSRIVQHELDHLDGKLFIDRLSMMKRDTIKKHIKRRIQSGDYVVLNAK